MLARNCANKICLIFTPAHVFQIIASQTCDTFLRHRVRMYCRSERWPREVPAKDASRRWREAYEMYRLHRSVKTTVQSIDSLKSSVNCMYIWNKKVLCFSATRIACSSYATSMTSVHPFVRVSLTLVNCDHIVQQKEKMGTWQNWLVCWPSGCRSPLWSYSISSHREFYRGRPCSRVWKMWSCALCMVASNG